MVEVLLVFVVEAVAVVVVSILVGIGIPVLVLVLVLMKNNTPSSILFIDQELKQNTSCNSL